MRAIVVNRWARHDAIERVGRHEVRHFNPTKYLDEQILRPYLTAEKIVTAHRRGRGSMQSMLTAFSRVVSEFGAQALVAHQNFFPPEWLLEEAGDLVRVLGCFDDPQQTYSTTLPVVWAFHGAYYCSPSYSATRRFEQAMATFGVKHTHWFPLSFTIPSASLVAAVEASWAHRRPQAVYIGQCYGDKVDKLARIDRGIGGRLKVFGRGWPLGGLAGFVAPLRGRAFFPKWVRSLDEEQRRSAYLTSLIGLNTHLGTGEETGNMRMYEVPMHGAMLLADKAGCDAHEDIFTPNVEAVYYDGVEDAVEKCLYYLGRPQEAVAIARRGFERARRDYHPTKVLSELLDWAATLGNRTPTPVIAEPA
jgi:Glycosyl transferases group 1